VSDGFKIWIDRLSDGQIQKIKSLFPPAFLDVDEKELKFPFPVEVSGEAYLADMHLLLRLKASTRAVMPCIICNKMIETELKIVDFYHTEPLSDIRDAIFDFSDVLREALLSELPKYVECCSGNCPQREAIAPFLRKRSGAQPDVHFPFGNLGSEQE
jgi:hypothetical protein